MTFHVTRSEDLVLDPVFLTRLCASRTASQNLLSWKPDGDHYVPHQSYICEAQNIIILVSDSLPKGREGLGAWL